MYYLSIVTVVYNDIVGFERTRDSLLPLPNGCEWIIVDGKSSDGTSEKIQQLPVINEIKYISESDKGIFDAMNKSIDLVSGDYILFLNAGDFIDRDALNQILSMKNCENDVYVYDYNILDKSLAKVNARSLKSSPECLKRMSCFPHQSTLIRKVIFDEIGRYDQKYTLSGDYEFFARLYSKNKYKIKMDNSLKLSYFILDGVSSNLKYGLKQAKQHSDIQKKYFGNYSKIRYIQFSINYCLSYIPGAYNFIMYLRKIIFKSRL